MGPTAELSPSLLFSKHAKCKIRLEHFKLVLTGIVTNKNNINSFTKAKTLHNDYHTMYFAIPPGGNLIKIL